MQNRMAGGANPRAPTDKEAFFFLNILNCMKNTPDVSFIGLLMVLSRLFY